MAERALEREKAGETLPLNKILTAIAEEEGVCPVCWKQHTGKCESGKVAK